MDPDSNPDLNPKYIMDPDPDPNLQIISDRRIGIRIHNTGIVSYLLLGCSADRNSGGEAEAADGDAERVSHHLGQGAHCQASPSPLTHRSGHLALQRPRQVRYQWGRGSFIVLTTCFPVLNSVPDLVVSRFFYCMLVSKRKSYSAEKISRTKLKLKN